MIKQIFSIFILVGLLAISCSRDKNTALSRAYHNTTSHYNGYFNAREILKAQEEIIKAAHVEDYSQILPIFIYPNEASSQSLYPEMDKVIEKCSEVIERHSIYKKKKENIKWIDDAYFLIGKARLYKEETSLAEQTFLWVYQRYKKDPQRYRGLNWLIKSFVKTKQWDRAEKFLDLAEEQVKKYPDELKGHFYAIYASYHLQKSRDYDKAIENLSLAVEQTKEKEDKRRYAFILAQIYQKKNQLQLATQYYSQVLKLKPDYTMRFNARINRAIAFDASGGDSRNIKKELHKMLRDSKNETFQDQIYYALAEVELKEDNEPQAIDYLVKSAQVSVTNSRQKGLSYLKLADIYFDHPHYINAQAYYDSTIQHLPQEHPDYIPAEDKNNSLQDLVSNLKEIQRQDSLLMLSKLSKKEQKKKVKGIIKALKEEEERRKQAELAKVQERQNAAGITANNFGSTNGKGKTYFYNPRTIALGATAFKDIWGNRANEDNWRRKSKQTTAVIAQNKQEERDSTKQEEPVAESEKYQPEFYLKNIPKNIEEQLVAHGKIAEALFNVGAIFKESFTDYTSAIVAFERVIKQYDTSKFNLPSHYQLYRIYTLLEEDDKAQLEKDWVLNKHPFSEYAYLIKNPNYSKESKETKEKVEEFYASTYQLFKYNLYSDVIASCEKADESFETNHLKAKFDFIKAKSIGNVRSKEEFKQALEAVVKDHPNDPVKKSAEEILSFLARGGASSEDSKPKVNYQYNENDKHLFILSAQVTQAASFQKLKNNLADFNNNFFRESNLKVTQSALNKNSLYLVRTFENQENAVRYLKALRNNSALMFQINTLKAKNYLISNTNFKTLFQSKDESLYLEFFNTEYTL